MKRVVSRLAALLLAAAPLSAPAHGCEALDRYLIGHYHGECDKETELAHGQGESQGADRYVGQWVQGRPGGRGTYTWENGARFVGRFRDGLADGDGEFIAASGVRYSGVFVRGALATLRPGDCPTTPGPVACARP